MRKMGIMAVSALRNGSYNVLPDNFWVAAVRERGDEMREIGAFRFFPSSAGRPSQWKDAKEYSQRLMIECLAEAVLAKHPNEWEAFVSGYFAATIFRENEVRKFAWSKSLPDFDHDEILDRAEDEGWKMEGGPRWGAMNFAHQNNAEPGGYLNAWGSTREHALACYARNAGALGDNDQRPDRCAMLAPGAAFACIKSSGPIPANYFASLGGLWVKRIDHAIAPREIVERIKSSPRDAAWAELEVELGIPFGIIGGVRRGEISPSDRWPQPNLSRSG